MAATDDKAEQGDMSRHLEQAAASFEALAALDMLEDSVVVIDRDRRYLFMNQAALNRAGLDKAAVLGKRYLDVFPDIAGSQVDLAIQRAFESPGKISIEYQQDLSGRWYHVDILSSGATVTVYARDVTEPKLAVQLNRRLMNSLDSLSEPIIMMDREVRYTFVNRAAANFVGMDRSVLVGRNVWELSPWLKETPFGQGCLRALGETQPFTIENFYKPRERWLNVHYFPGPDGFTVHIADIHDLRQTQDRLHNLLNGEATLERMHQAFELMPHPVMMVDSDLRYTYVNAAGREPNQRTLEQMIGVPFQVLNPLLVGSELEERCQKALEGGERQTVEFLLRPAGRWFQVQIIPWHDQLILSSVDISKQKSSEESVGILTSTLEQAMGDGWDRPTARDGKRNRPKT